ncbi:hypothetical protein O6H91_05G035800 [Diphasiastrum complanatum]|uniref:Uncharacterized protein n=3 Tax=Diphasiastrum complanatum TaxID=34168 RepID=A0ACC2DM98_DIPCM|nr:hypothetical protein O6H91_05G034700 [Diphasiastrum complanatum]KAJ7555378.1 hypothetical protein O6H91_05G034700 [Diphasiastrum complanatum]KAJ7555401.1 hypothetical protein O6H91_05G035800 [Diphasiastrum complanatum]
MAGGGVVAAGGKSAHLYEGRTTLFVAIACIVAASGGLIFGYDLGISGGVTSMDDFLIKFFPVVERHKNQATKDTDYCKYDNQRLTAFTSSLYLAALVTSLGASVITRRYGRRPSILLGGLSFLIGAILNAAAANITMLILGRIMLGVGVGFGNQAVPLYLSEMAPAKLRGAMNIMFQLAITIGILAANVINYGTAKLKPWGWRLSLGLAAVPATIMFVGGLFLPETPNSLVERGHLEKGRRLLEKVRGITRVDAEYEDLVEASRKANAVKHPFRNILKKRNRPQLVMATLIPFFQQFTGINAIMFYAPVLFKTIGFGGDASLYSAVITGAVNVLATLVSIFTVDKWGRRVLFLEAGVQMFLSQVVIAIILAEKFGGSMQLPKGYAVFVVIVICIYVAGFAWSWGPLGWLVPSEIFPLETRSAGQSITVAVNMLFTFVIAQAFLAMLCHFKYGIFLFFAGWVVIMSIFVYFFLPETKNVPIENMIYVWRKHWFWKQIIPPADASLYEGEDNSNGQFPTEVENNSVQVSQLEFKEHV